MKNSCTDKYCAFLPLGGTVCSQMLRQGINKGICILLKTDYSVGLSDTIRRVKVTAQWSSKMWNGMFWYHGMRWLGEMVVYKVLHLWFLRPPKLDFEHWLRASWLWQLENVQNVRKYDMWYENPTLLCFYSPRFKLYYGFFTVMT